jgi:hypothetical protein
MTVAAKACVADAMRCADEDDRANGQWKMTLHRTVMLAAIFGAVAGVWGGFFLRELIVANHGKVGPTALRCRRPVGEQPRSRTDALGSSIRT